MSRNKRNHSQGIRFIVVFVAALCGLSPSIIHASKGPEEWAMLQLDHVREQKAQQLRDHCERIHNLALKAAQDKVVLQFFLVNLNFARAAAQGAVPKDLQDNVAEIRAGFNQYYIQNYLTFYDFLFIDMDGNVFYTLRKELDLDANLTQDEIDGLLAKCIKKRPTEEVFVDFHQYRPSREPGAFFVEPIHSEGVQAGWLVLQHSINRINMIFAWMQDIGATGETFLVNDQGYMLTESNFKGDSTILTQRLDNRNIEPKFTEGKGNRVVTDYRGITAITSFEVVPFMGTQWLVVAKIDQDEVLTNHYMQRQWYYKERLGEVLEKLYAPPNSSAIPPVPDARLSRVDMDELLRAEPDQWLETFGISTCTGLIGSDAGRFGYMAHISPRDMVYGGSETDLLGQLTMRIKTFDVRPCEMRNVSFSIIAPHFNSLTNIVSVLLNEGFLLSQIRVFINPNALSAAVAYDYQSNQMTVTWKMGMDSKVERQSLSDGVLFSDAIRELMRQDHENESALMASEQ